MPALLLVWSFAAVVGSTGSGAQDSAPPHEFPSLQAGQTIRVTTAQLQRQTALLVGRQENRLLFRPLASVGGREVVRILPLAEIDTLWIRRHHTGLGALAGAGAGALTGTALCVFSENCEFIPLFAALGAPLGAGVGALVPRWRRSYVREPGAPLVVAGDRMAAALPVELGTGDVRFAPGARVRVSTKGLRPRRQVGTVELARGDTLFLRFESGRPPRPIPRAAISGLEVSAGRKSAALKGAGIGFLIGAGTGLAVAAAVTGLGTADCKTSEMGCGWIFLVLGVGGAGSGLFVGTVVGALQGSERWEAVPTDQVQLGANSEHRHTPALGWSISF